MARVKRRKQLNNIQSNSIQLALQNMGRARRAPPARSIGNLLLGQCALYQDLGVHVVQTLSGSHLVMCSMVCRGLRRLVDKFCSATFANDLLWWFCYPKHASTHAGADPSICASFDGDETRFGLEVTVNSECDSTLWMLNASLRKNIAIKMRMHVMLPSASPHVFLLGDAKNRQKITSRGYASVDVLKWRVLGFEENAAGRYTVTLAAIDFAHNSAKVVLELGVPLVLTLKNVPRQSWPYRCLWVMRGIRKCMHCHERWRAMQSFDVPHSNHRVLCLHCLELLYARESQLVRKWRVQLSRLPFDRVPRVNFVNCFMGAPMSVYPARPDRFVLKSAVAEEMGCRDWIQFIQRNHAIKTKMRRVKEKDPATARYYFNTRWW
jgi:hypothetical protein